MRIGLPLDNDNNATAVSWRRGREAAGGGAELGHVRGCLWEFTVRPAAGFSWLPDIRTARKGEMRANAGGFSSRGAPVLYCGMFFFYFDQDLHNGTVASLPYAGDGF